MIEDTTGITDIQLQNVKESNDVVIKTPVLDQDQRSALKEALAQDYGVEKARSLRIISAVWSAARCVKMLFYRL